jgi:hypothetical protein
VKEKIQNASQHAGGLEDHKIIWEVTKLYIWPLKLRTFSGISEKHGRTV